MKVTPASLAECLILEPKIFTDDRGFFMETWNRAQYAPHGIGPDFVQSNVSRSERGVLRGLHYQWPNPQGKLIWVEEGEAYDVAVDIRRGSPTFGRWTTALLSAKNKRQFWIPAGFAHGFVALADSTLVSYLCTVGYDPAADASLAWNDPTIGIHWPVTSPSLSPKDADAPRLEDVPLSRLPEYPGAA